MADGQNSHSVQDYVSGEPQTLLYHRSPFVISKGGLLMVGQRTGTQAPPHLVSAQKEEVGTSSAAQLPAVQEALSASLWFLSAHPQLSQIGVELKCL